MQVTEDGGHQSFETSDGSLYYFRNVGDGEVWKMPESGGDPERLLTGLDQKQWAVFDRGICFVADADQNPQTLSFYDFETGAITPFAELPEHTTVDGSPGLSVSPDGLQVVVSLTENQGGDIMLVEDFR